MATATATLSNGVLTSVSVVEPGYDYTQPHAVATGGSLTVPAVLEASGGRAFLLFTTLRALARAAVRIG